MPLTDHAIRRLKPAQRELLVDHIDGAVELAVSYMVQTRASLLKAGLLRGHPVGTARPRQTVLTEAGRHAVGVILGDAADSLVRAGLLEQDNPLAVLRRLQSDRQSPVSGEVALKPARMALSALKK
jgi:hypothetical protein